MSPMNFLKTAIKDLKVGAVMPSSKYAVQKILREVKSDHQFVIEYGAGDGVITKEILKILPKDGRLVAVELNKNFASDLKKIKDRRLSVINDDAVIVSQSYKNLDLEKMNLVISGIPFSFLRPKAREELIRNTYKILPKGGKFLVYQASFLILPILKKVFGKVKVDFELRNFPPYFIMVAER